MPLQKSFFTLLLALGLPVIVSAAPLGRSFTYQGQLSQSGTPINGTVHLRFSLWDAAGTGDPPTGGAMVGAAQIVTDVPVSNGTFSVALNGGDEFGAQAFNGDARWLQVEVCSDAGCSSTTVLGPRQAITGAPYSLGPWQASGTDLSYTGGNVGIGITSPSHSLHVKLPTPAMILQDTATPANQTGYLAFWNNNPSETGWVGYGHLGQPLFSVVNVRPAGDIQLYTAAGQTLVAKSSGSVGIGTSTPASKLEVRGDIRLGPSGEYFAPSSSENLRVIRGKVTSTGVQALGTGFTCSRTGTGLYQINFSPAFPAIGGSPDITISPESSSSFFVALVTLSSPTVATLRIVTASNTAADATFHFIAVGPR